MMIRNVLCGFAVLGILTSCATDPGASGPKPEQMIALAPPGVNPLPVGDMGVPTLDISRLDMLPIARRQARPNYPADLRRRGRGGEGLVDFIVDENGVPRNVFSYRATHPDFGFAAVEAVATWRFSPGRKDGRVVRTHMQVPIVFTLDEN